MVDERYECGDMYGGLLTTISQWCSLRLLRSLSSGGGSGLLMDLAVARTSAHSNVVALRAAGSRRRREFALASETAVFEMSMPRMRVGGKLSCVWSS